MTNKEENMLPETMWVFLNKKSLRKKKVLKTSAKSKISEESLI